MLSGYCINDNNRGKKKTYSFDSESLEVIVRVPVYRSLITSVLSLGPPLRDFGCQNGRCDLTLFITTLYT